jgi:ceramide glucosyltransferase
MIVLAIISIVGTLCGIFYCLVSLACAVSFGMRRRDSGSTAFAPPVSILKPLCGLDPHAYTSLRSHCMQDYPAFEIIFGVADPADEILPTVEKVRTEFPDVPIKLVQCPQQLGTNLKISNLVQMLPHARHKLLLINDSDIEVPDDYLRRVVAPLEDRSVGMVTCLYRGAAAESIGSKLESLGISSDFIPGVLTAKRFDGGLRFGLGSTLAFSRKALDAAGGFGPLADYLADDYQLGYRITQAGLKVELADCVVDHYLPPYSLGEFVQHQLRWARTIRASRPSGYLGLIFTFAIPWSLLSIALIPDVAWVWVLFASALALRYAVMLATAVCVLRDPAPFRSFWLLPLRDIAALAVWISCYAGRQVVWRGKRFELVNGKLRAV